MEYLCVEYDSEDATDEAPKPGHQIVLFAILMLIPLCSCIALARPIATGIIHVRVRWLSLPHGAALEVGCNARRDVRRDGGAVELLDIWS